MSQITVKGSVYQCGKLNAVSQFHVVRRLGPMLVIAGISVEMVRQGMKIALEDMVAMSGPILDLLSKMSDEDTNYILFTCLSVVQRQQGNAFAPVTTKDTRQLLFEDMEMPTLLRLVVEVLKENLGNFLTELGDGQALTSSSAPDQAAATSP